MNSYYRLVNSVPTPCTQKEWEESRKGIKSLLFQTKVSGHILVSTIFVGTVACLFETMVFDCKDREICCIRSATYAEALEAHCKTLKELSNEPKTVEVLVEDVSVADVSVADIVAYVNEHGVEGLSLDIAGYDEGEKYLNLAHARLETAGEVLRRKAYAVKSFHNHVIAVKREAERLGLNIQELVK